MSNILAELSLTGPVLADGAWGTELQKRGLPVGELPDLWNLTHPETVADIARAYVEAGSRVILTNSFRANRIALGLHGARVREINQAGVAISKQAARGRANVFASLGPSGHSVGNSIADDELSDVFREQAELLAAGGAEALVIETMTDLREAKLALAAAHETGLPVIGCMAFDQNGRVVGNDTITVEQSLPELESCGAGAIGTNCGGTAAEMLNVVERMRAATRLPIWVKPHAGLPVMENGRPIYRSNPEEFAWDAMLVVSAGADFIGGCCGTGPEHIRSLVLRMTGGGLS
jgi:methionine synthase I (cobalamin-dependent)